MSGNVPSGQLYIRLIPSQSVETTDSWPETMEQKARNKKKCLSVNVIGYFFLDYEDLDVEWRHIISERPYVYLIYFVYFSGDRQCTKFTDIPSDWRMKLGGHYYFPMLYNLLLHTPRLDPCPGRHTFSNYRVSPAIHAVPMDLLNQRGSQPNIWHRWIPRTTSFQSDVGGG